MNRRRFIFMLIALTLIASITSCKFPTKNNPGSSNAQKTMLYTALDSTSVPLNSGEVKAVLGGIDITIEGGNKDSAAVVTLEEYDNSLFKNEASIADGKGFLLKDLPADFSGRIKVSLDIPEDVLKAYEKQKSDRAITLLLGQYVFSPSMGSVNFQTQAFPDVVVDLQSKKITVELDFSTQMAYASQSKMANLRPTGIQKGLFNPQWWETTPKHLFFKVTAGVLENKTTVGNFTIHFPKNLSAGAVVDALRESKEKLESDALNFELDQELHVYIEDCDSKDSKFSIGTWGFGSVIECDGQFSLSRLGNPYVVISPKIFAQGMEKQLLATVGHELMHFAQYLVYQDYPLIESFETLDESTAVWFESYLLEDPNWMSPLAEQQIDFIYSPWWFATGKIARTGGYGASWFVDDIATVYGADFIREAYSSDNKDGHDAWRNGVERVSGFPISEMFRAFLQEYLLNPEGVSTNLGALARFAQLNDQKIILKFDAATMSVNFQALDSIPETANVTPIPGTINSTGEMNEAPAISISRDLNAMNGYMFIVNFLKQSPAELQTPRPLTVSVSGADAEYTGMMVYGIPAGAPLSSAALIADSINPIFSGGSLTIPNFGASGGGATYDRVAVIMFNDNWAKIDPTTVTVTVTYGSSGKEFSGDGYATAWNYDENVCYLEETCHPPLEPPACYKPPDFSGGGGGGGDDAKPVLPCTIKLPEFCYGNQGCGACAGGNNFIHIGRYNDHRVFLIESLKLDADGQLTDIGILWLNVVGPPSVTSGPNGFEISFVIMDSTDQPKGYLKMQGTFNASGGGGTWVAGHECTGDAVSGTWSVEQIEKY